MQSQDKRMKQKKPHPNAKAGGWHLDSKFCLKRGEKVTKRSCLVSCVWEWIFPLELSKRRTILQLDWKMNLIIKRNKNDTFWDEVNSSISFNRTPKYSFPCYFWPTAPDVVNWWSASCSWSEQLERKAKAEQTHTLAGLVVDFCSVHTNAV